jgi:hypothetical protein
VLGLVSAIRRLRSLGVYLEDIEELKRTTSAYLSSPSLLRDGILGKVQEFCLVSDIRRFGSVGGVSVILLVSESKEDIEELMRPTSSSFSSLSFLRHGTFGKVKELCLVIAIFQRQAGRWRL